ncbi:MAG: PAS domain S-box protein [Streptosporangiaceae bacterium]
MSNVRQIADPIIAGLLEAAPDAMVCVDSDGQIVLVNAQTERLFGYPRDELTGQPVEILVPDASKASHSGLRARYTADPVPRLMGAGLDLSGRRRDGTTFPAEISLSALDTDQGILISAAIRDVQQQAWAMADRTLIREALRNLLDNAWKFTTGRDRAAIEFGTTPAANARVCCYVRDNGAGFDPLTPASYSRHSSACTPPASSPAPASASPPCARSWTGTAAAPGPRAQSTEAPRSPSPSRQQNPPHLDREEVTPSGSRWCSTRGRPGRWGAA